MAQSVITYLYLIVPFVSTAAWVPQLVKLVKQPSSREGMSVPTWALWTFTGWVSVAYVAIVVFDMLLLVTLTLNALGQTVTLVFALLGAARASRHKDATGE